MPCILRCARCMWVLRMRSARSSGVCIVPVVKGQRWHGGARSHGAVWAVFHRVGLGFSALADFIAGLPGPLARMMVDISMRAAAKTCARACASGFVRACLHTCVVCVGLVWLACSINARVSPYVGFVCLAWCVGLCLVHGVLSSCMSRWVGVWRCVLFCAW